MAVDEAGLEQAAIVRAPGGVGWDDDMGRFGALVKTLRLCGVASLAGLPLPDPKHTRFDAMVKQMFDAATEQSAQLPLVPAQDAEPAALGTAAGSPPLQLQQQAPAPQLPAPQGSTVGEAPETAAAGEATGAPQPMEVAKPQRAGAPRPMEVEAPPAPAPTEAPPLLGPPSALRGLDLNGLVAELKRVLAAAPLDEAMVGHVLDGLEGLRLSRQEMLDSGAPPPAAREPSVPEHLHRAHPPAQPPTLHPLTAPHRRVQAGRQAVQARSACSAQRSRHRAVEAVDVGFGFRVLMPSVRGVRCACTACTLECGVNECVHVRE